MTIKSTNIPSSPISYLFHKNSLFWILPIFSENFYIPGNSLYHKSHYYYLFPHHFRIFIFSFPDYFLKSCYFLGSFPVGTEPENVWMLNTDYILGSKLNTFFCCKIPLNRFNFSMNALKMYATSLVLIFYHQLLPFLCIPRFWNFPQFTRASS